MRIRSAPASWRSLGKVLFSYFPVTSATRDSECVRHSNVWESREIVRILNKMDRTVDAIDWMDDKFYPQEDYEMVFDIYTNLQRLCPFLDPSTRRVLHLTGQYHVYQNLAEIRRVEDLERRTGKLYSPKRLVKSPELFERSLRLAHICSLIGNEHTLGTFPEKYHYKIRLVTVSASLLRRVKSRAQFVPQQREFTWFFGGGAVHKGLDLVLEVFDRHPELTLNVIGDVESERDFMLIYGDLLTRRSNIHYHGYLSPSSDEFRQITDRSFCFVAPSCSESISSAAATMMQVGLYPIISRETGVTLPTDCGIYLEKCTHDEIERSVLQVHQTESEELTDQIDLCQRYALVQFSRGEFSRQMERFLTECLASEFVDMI